MDESILITNWWGTLLRVAVVALCAIASARGAAQERRPPVKIRPQSEIAIEGGSSVGNIHVFAYSNGRRINPFGVEYDRHSWGGLLGARVDYLAEFLPVVPLNEPAIYGADGRALTTARKTHYGFGFSPVGVRMLWRRNSNFRPYLMGKGGILRFHTHVLSPQASKLNFSAQFGGGLQAALTSRMDLSLGYTDFHFSNGDVAARNPGIDFMYLNAGLVFRFHSAGR